MSIRKESSESIRQIKLCCSEMNWTFSRPLSDGTHGRPHLDRTNTHNRYYNRRHIRSITQRDDQKESIEKIVYLSIIKLSPHSFLPKGTDLLLEALNEWNESTLLCENDLFCIVPLR